MIDQLKERFGAHRVLEPPVNSGETPLLLLDLDLRSKITILMTNGLSDYRMPVPEKMEGYEHNEIYFCLPSYWEWEDRTNPNTNWIFDWIQRLSKYVVENNTWFGHGHTMPCGKEMASLSPLMKQNHFFLSSPMLLEKELVPIQIDDKTVHFLSIIPIFPDEMDYKQGKGTLKFVRKMENKGVTELLDDFRSSVLKRRWLRR